MKDFRGITNELAPEFGNASGDGACIFAQICDPQLSNDTTQSVAPLLLLFRGLNGSVVGTEESQEIVVCDVSTSRSAPALLLGIMKSRNDDKEMKQWKDDHEKVVLWNAPLKPIVLKCLSLIHI